MGGLLSVDIESQGLNCSYRICNKTTRKVYFVRESRFCSAECAALAIVYAETGITHQLVEAFGS